MSKSDKALYLFATIRPRAEHFDDARRALEELVPRTLAEPGCRQFALHEDLDGEDCLYLYEEFANESALEAHYAQDYTKDVLANYEEWLAKPVNVTKMRVVGAAKSTRAR